jgi:hypothetical protein
MNIGNYIVNRYLTDNLKTDGEEVNFTPCDVLQMNLMMFEQMDMKFIVVPDLVYDHEVHDGSIYSQTSAQFSEFNERLHERFRALAGLVYIFHNDPTVGKDEF